ncbi:hypothetical protein ACJX0J_042316, partial [Zea mays]
VFVFVAAECETPQDAFIQIHSSGTNVLDYLCVID